MTELDVLTSEDHFTITDEVLVSEIEAAIAEIATWPVWKKVMLKRAREAEAFFMASSATNSGWD